MIGFGAGRILARFARVTGVMKFHAASIGLFLLSACSTTQQTNTVPTSGDAQCSATLPDTVLGERTAALLDVIDSGDPERIATLVEAQFSAEFRQLVPVEAHVAALAGLHEQTGGVTVCRVEYASDTRALVLLGSAESDALHYMSILLDDAAPHLVDRLRFDPADPAALAHPPAPLDDATRHALIEGVAESLDDYIFADVAAAMQARIRGDRDAGRYAALTHGLALAEQLTEDLREVSHDLHLAIRYSPTSIPDRAPAPPSAEEIEQMRAEAARQNYGITRVDTLPGNVGYIDLRMFWPAEIAREGLGPAMSQLAGTDSLIVDLRLNHGGDPEAVAFMTSYLFGDEKVHLNDLYYRRTDETREYWTDPSVPGQRFGPDKPVYVLISGETFSGGEEFANNLRELGRATLIGESTGGGAHPVEGIRVDEHLLAIVPVGRAINPISKGNWEGTGVQPHVEVAPAEALDRALALIRERG